MIEVHGAMYRIRVAGTMTQSQRRRVIAAMAAIEADPHVRGRVAGIARVPELLRAIAKHAVPDLRPELLARLDGDDLRRIAVTFLEETKREANMLTAAADAIEG